MKRCSDVISGRTKPPIIELLLERYYCVTRTISKFLDPSSTPCLSYTPVASLTTVLEKMSGAKAEFRGSEYTENYRVFFKDEAGNYVSPFHDIPLYADKENHVFNMVVEIPRWTNAKMEIATKDKLNPIKQDEKKGKLRFVHNCFPHHGYIWNYGAFPQTWENPNAKDPHTGEKGDNDPIDVIEIGSRVAKRGEVIPVKVLGIIAMLDDGETDWKVLAIDVRDPLAVQINDIKDMEKHMPGYLSATVEWFRIYKMPGGSPPNEFAFNGEAKDRAFAMRVIEETHHEWLNLMSGKTDKGKLELVCTSTDVGGKKISADEAAGIAEEFPTEEAPAEIPEEVSEWYYVGSAYDGAGSKACVIM
jgi:inorganic pyrophosphatase